MQRNLHGNSSESFDIHIEMFQLLEITQRYSKDIGQKCIERMKCTFVETELLL